MAMSCPSRCRNRGQYPKVPFAIEQPTGDLSASKPVTFSAKITHDTRATRSMMWLWTGDASGQGQGYRVLATGQKGTFQLPSDLAATFPAVLHLRLYGMNANGKVYEVDAGCGLNSEPPDSGGGHDQRKRQPGASQWRGVA